MSFCTTYPPLRAVEVNPAQLEDILPGTFDWVRMPVLGDGAIGIVNSRGEVGFGGTLIRAERVARAVLDVLPGDSEAVRFAIWQNARGGLVEVLHVGNEADNRQIVACGAETWLELEYEHGLGRWIFDFHGQLQALADPRQAGALAQPLFVAARPYTVTLTFKDSRGKSATSRAYLAPGSTPQDVQAWVTAYDAAVQPLIDGRLDAVSVSSRLNGEGSCTPDSTVKRTGTVEFRHKAEGLRYTLTLPALADTTQLYIRPSPTSKQEVFDTAHPFAEALLAWLLAPDDDLPGAVDARGNSLAFCPPEQIKGRLKRRRS